MYTIQENVRIVVALLKQYNIRHIVISPGGTNIPISQAVQDDSFFHCYSVPDERVPCILLLVSIYRLEKLLQLHVQVRKLHEIMYLA